ncbi:MAG: FAD binding domain-containing protein [Deltaproteobacteria bacterium]|nr:FAD binding domain-containing protein [Deltaproteobacteria bacterium]
MSNIQAYLRPDSLEGALALLAEHQERARPLAGGTSLIFSHPPRVEVLVDLAGAGLDHVEHAETGGVDIGSMTSCSHLATALRGRQLDKSALTDALATLYTPVLRNHITVGGNCVMVYGWSHLPVTMWALDARFMVVSHKAKPRDVDADTFFERHPLRWLGAGELLTQITVKSPAEGSGSAFLKFGRDKSDEGIASVAVSLRLQDEKVASARLVVGSTRPMPQKLDDVAALVVGKRPSKEVFAEAGEAAAKAVVASDNYLGSADYRRHIVASLVRDALAKATQRAGGAA